MVIKNQKNKNKNWSPPLEVPIYLRHTFSSWFIQQVTQGYSLATTAKGGKYKKCETQAFPWQKRKEKPFLPRKRESQLAKRTRCRSWSSWEMHSVRANAAGMAPRHLCLKSKYAVPQRRFSRVKDRWNHSIFQLPCRKKEITGWFFSPGGNSCGWIIYLGKEG